MQVEKDYPDYEELQQNEEDEKRFEKQAICTYCFV